MNCVNTLGGIKSGQKIPTLEEWLQEFSDDPRLQLIWLDVKIKAEKDLTRFVKVMHTLLSEHQIPPEKIQFSTHEEGRYYSLTGKNLADVQKYNKLCDMIMKYAECTMREYRSDHKSLIGKNPIHRSIS